MPEEVNFNPRTHTWASLISVYTGNMKQNCQKKRFEILKTYSVTFRMVRPSKLPKLRDMLILISKTCATEKTIATVQRLLYRTNIGNNKIFKKPWKYWIKWVVRQKLRKRGSIFNRKNFPYDKGSSLDWVSDNFRGI